MGLGMGDRIELNQMCACVFGNNMTRVRGRGEC